MLPIFSAAELGDYNEELDAHHLENKQYVPNQEYLDHKIIRFHKKHRCISSLAAQIIHIHVPI